MADPLLQPDEHEDEGKYIKRFLDDPGMQAKFPDRSIRLLVAKGEYVKLDRQSDIRAALDRPPQIEIPARVRWSE
jgi:hypothetical protein